ncbi:MAG: phage integrase N-terminal SAM-like domain-containing protein, partial [Verrucomicrobia bacterium]|nr:phage integrase N-terminal SAM-like domain-containing protein [Verrucomicrobiota bacterium]
GPTGHSGTLTPARSGNSVMTGTAVSEWKRAFLTVVRRRNYSYRTEQSYLVWLERFARFCQSDELATRGRDDVKGFLDGLALDRRISASSQRQALNAVVFLLREVFQKELGDFSEYRRARMRRHAPTWLTRSELQALVEGLPPFWALMTRVAFGGGLRLMELLRLRVKDVDLEHEIITVRGGKGDKDRLVPLAHVAVEPLRTHMVEVRRNVGVLQPLAEHFQVPGLEHAVHGVFQVLEEIAHHAHSQVDRRTAALAEPVATMGIGHVIELLSQFDEAILKPSAKFIGAARWWPSVSVAGGE